MPVKASRPAPRRPRVEQLLGELVREVRGLRAETREGREHTSRLFRDLTRTLELHDQRLQLLEAARLELNPKPKE